MIKRIYLLKTKLLLPLKSNFTTIFYNECIKANAVIIVYYCEGKRMNKILLSLLVLPVIVFSTEGITAGSTVSRPITKPTLPINRPVRPVVRPVVNTGLVYQDNYYNTNTTNSCESHIEIINQKDMEIAALKKELESLKNKEQAKLQKKLQKEYNQELKEFDNRKVDRTTKSRAVISDKPVD